MLSAANLGDTPRESAEFRRGTPNGSNLSVSVWSDRDTEKFGPSRRRHRLVGWPWKRLAIVAAILVAFIVALAVGLAVGLKKKGPAR